MVRIMAKSSLHFLEIFLKKKKLKKRSKDTEVLKSIGNTKNGVKKVGFQCERKEKKKLTQLSHKEVWLPLMAFVARKSKKMDVCWNEREEKERGKGEG